MATSRANVASSSVSARAFATPSRDASPGSLSAPSSFARTHRNESTLSIAARPIHAIPSAIVDKTSINQSISSRVSQSVWGTEAHRPAALPHPTTVSRLASPRAPRTTNDSSVTFSRYPAVTPRAYGRARRIVVAIVSLGVVGRSRTNQSLILSFDARRVARDRSRAPVLVLVVVIFFAVLNLRHGVARARVRV